MSAPRCQCGCGEVVRLAPRTDPVKGWVRGVPLKYLRGHNAAANARRQTERSIGSRGLSSHGYVRILVAKGVRVYEHVLVAERALGRPLRGLGRGHPDTEVVHHVNGDKQDNRPENLVVCTHAYHVELHHRLERSSAWPEFAPVARTLGKKLPSRRRHA